MSRTNVFSASLFIAGLFCSAHAQGARDIQSFMNGEAQSLTGDKAAEFAPAKPVNAPPAVEVAQPKKLPDWTPIKTMVGCFKVTYHYEEKGQPNYDEAGREWIVLNEKEGFLFLQHYGVSEEDGQATSMKHWAQRWTPQQNGQWLQEVLSPSDAPRYQCTAAFTKTAEGVFQRICEAAGAPKPRRDRKRSDYAVLDRVHTVVYAATSWTDNQNNVKKDKDGEEVAKETGVNLYTRIDDAQCQVAIDDLKKQAADANKQQPSPATEKGGSAPAK
jgi:hypothetical protein